MHIKKTKQKQQQQIKSKSSFWKNSTWHTKADEKNKQEKKEKKIFCVHAAAAKTKWKGEKKVAADSVLTLPVS